ncbi:MAG: M20 family metallopeptidase [Pyramidobacter sp.]|uniref:M20 metallopeptidase family protein n=1 Tax=Pyramidobacter sp. TaxID=1943581 RepID=UPI002A8251F3|nr:M20 family metallopeptidase [Pyramidobacter sp.]MDY4032156.1 M20 family metallopeptidase [Pyramidobacter sp.]
MELLKLASSVVGDVTAWRHHLHAHPELSGQEVETSAFVERTLREMGADEVRRAGKTGVVALVRGARPGPVFALRADMDALPVPELADVEFKSRNENVMHACGHDVHTAVLLGAAKALCGVRGQIHGAVKFFFQPAEETGRGAREMIAAGELDEKDPPACIAALHVFPGIPAGTLGVRRGAFNASSDSFSLDVIGRQGHGAYPELCIDPIAVGAQVITALQQLVSREVAPQDSAVVTIGTIHGGVRSNIIAPDVKMTGTIRTVRSRVREHLFEAIPRVARLTAEALRACAGVEIREGTPVLVNDDGMFDRLVSVAERVVGKDRIVAFENCSMGGEDFAFFTERVPGVMFRLGVGFKDKDNAPLHSSCFKADESAFVCGVAALTGLALDVCR